MKIKKNQNFSQIIHILQNLFEKKDNESRIKMKKKLRSREWIGGKEKMGFVHRSWLRNQGYPGDHFRGKSVI